MGKIIDLHGQTFGRLTVLAQVKPPDTPRSWRSLNWAYWLCECQEGNRVVVRGANLRSGNTKSCGCFKREQLSTATRTHRKVRVAPVDGHAAFNQGIAWALKQLLAADHQDAADTLSREADALLATWSAENRQKIDTLFRTITRVADDGRAVVVRG